MTSTLYIDLETYSPTDLRSAGVYRYAADPGFLVLMAAWSLDGGPVAVAVGDAVRDIPGLLDPAVRKVAHNANFDRVCMSELLGQLYLDPDQWDCTAARAGEAGYPQGLKDLALALGGEQKDEAGTRLIKLFCVPSRQGHRVLPEDRPEEWDEMIRYCAQDVATLVDVGRRLPPLTPTERAVWVADQRINDRGIAVDLEMAEAAVPAAEENRMLQELEISHSTGVANPGSPPQMLAWLQGSGLANTDMRADTIVGLLEGDLSEQQRRVLELRQELALVAGKKYISALAGVSSDGRLRGGFKFFGAHTGRWTSKGVQLHNMPRAALDSELAVDTAILELKMGDGADAATLKALVRALFVGPFTVVDYAAIEARVIAWLASEVWALEAFAAGRDIYTETAERMGGLTRAQGKVAVLALGYNGGVGSLKAMGAEGTDGQLQTMVDTWRRANPSIVDFWAQMDGAFQTGGVAGRIVVEKNGGDRLLRLPSGRAIVYHDVRWDWVETQYGPKRQATFADPKKRGARAKTYGGRLCENVTQAVARDIMAEALVRLLDAGYAVVGHVHDEILVEGVGKHSVDVVSRIMDESPTWARGLPIASAGFTCARYRKG